MLIEKTAAYVARAGFVLEAEILSRQANNPQFAFLNPDNVYNPFYKAKIAQSLGVAVEFPESMIVPETPKIEEKVEQKLEQKVIVSKELSFEEKIMEEVSNCKRPSIAVEQTVIANEFDIKPLVQIMPVDSEIIKLTALYVARNGSRFLNGITQREQRNPQFDFLKPTHQLFTYFQKLVEAYSKVLHPKKEDLGSISKLASDWFETSQKLLAVAEKERQERQARASRNHVESERVASAMIDWQDFVVAGTIEFTDDEFSGATYLEPSGLNVQDITRFVHFALTGEAMAPSSGVGSSESMDMDMDIEMSSQPIPQYDDRKVDQSTKYQKCPICNELIPLDKISEHLRMELQDPKWKTQRQAHLDKYKDTNIATEDEMTKNLARLSAKKNALAELPIEAKTGPVDLATLSSKFPTPQTPVVSAPAPPRPQTSYVPPAQNFPIPKPSAVPMFQTPSFPPPPPLARVGLPPPPVSRSIPSPFPSRPTSLGGEPAAKKPKIETELIPENDWIAKHPVRDCMRHSSNLSSESHPDLYPYTKTRRPIRVQSQWTNS